MKMTPAIKGQITKAIRTATNRQMAVYNVKRIFARHMPTEQAKHAANKAVSA